jgi:hypothetical protein
VWNSVNPFLVYEFYGNEISKHKINDTIDHQTANCYFFAGWLAHLSVFSAAAMSFCLA